MNHLLGLLYLKNFQYKNYNYLRLWLGIPIWDCGTPIFQSVWMIAFFELHSFFASVRIAQTATITLSYCRFFSIQPAVPIRTYLAQYYRKASEIDKDKINKKENMYNGGRAGHATMKRKATPNRWNRYSIEWVVRYKGNWMERRYCMTGNAKSCNECVIGVFAAHRRMWTVTNYFLVNLSVSDLLLAVLNCFFNFVYMLNNDWPFGEVYCRISNFVANVTVAASVFTLTATSFDRYYNTHCYSFIQLPERLNSATRSSNGTW